MLEKLFIHQCFVDCLVGTEQVVINMQGLNMQEGSNRWEEEGSSCFVDFEQLGFFFSEVPISGYKFCITVPQMHPIRLRGLVSFAQIW